MSIIETYLNKLSKEPGLRETLNYLSWALKEDDHEMVLLICLRCLKNVIYKANSKNNKMALKFSQKKNKSKKDEDLEYFLNLNFCVENNFTIKAKKELTKKDLREYLEKQEKQERDFEKAVEIGKFALSIYYEIVSRLKDDWKLVLISNGKPIDQDKKYILGGDIEKEKEPGSFA